MCRLPHPPLPRQRRQPLPASSPLSPYPHGGAPLGPSLLPTHDRRQQKNHRDGQCPLQHCKPRFAPFSSPCSKWTLRNEFLRNLYQIRRKFAQTSNQFLTNFARICTLFLMKPTMAAPGIEVCPQDCHLNATGFDSHSSLLLHGKERNTQPLNTDPRTKIALVPTEPLKGNLLSKRDTELLTR